MRKQSERPEVEQGWSSRLDRKAWRYLARLGPGPRLQLPADRLVASITFDDVPESAVSAGAPLLEHAGVRGTFYVAAATCGLVDTHWTVASSAQVRALHEAGHEIGCHTARHVNVQSLDQAGIMAECDLNQQMLDEICGTSVTLTNFAYPFGDLGWRQQQILGRRFATCRTIYEHLNTGAAPAGRLGALGLFDATFDRARLGRAIADGRTRGGWLVFYTHDVATTPTFMGTSPAFLADTLQQLADAGVPVLTVREALASFGEERCARA